VAEIPPAAPQASKVLKISGETWNFWPTTEPMLEPICTMGPCSPAEPPEPIVTAEAKVLAQTGPAFIMPSWSTTAITSDTP
jgi:hypothetical protein